MIAANSIVDNKSAMIRVINTSINDPATNGSDIKLKSLNNPEILAISYRTENERTKALNKLKFSIMFNQPLTEICTKFFDIFGIEAKKVQTTPTNI